MRGLQFTAYVIRCAYSGDQSEASHAKEQWEIQKRFKDFRNFRADLIKAGAEALKSVQFPRKTVGRTSSDKTDQKRIPILQGWLNLVIGVYEKQPVFLPCIERFLERVDGQIPSAARLTVSRELPPFEPDLHQLEGDWLARGMNSFAKNRIEEERFSFRLEPDGLTLSGGPTHPAGEQYEYKLENIKLDMRDAARGIVYFEFHQVYQDGTRTGWYCILDRAHLHLTNGTWMALSGTHEGKQVGNFTADKILDDPTPGPYRVVCPAVLVRDGPDANSKPITTLDQGTEVEVVAVFRREDGVMRLCFSKAGIPIIESIEAGGERVEYTDGTERLWVSERKSDDQSLLLERIDEDEQEFAAASGPGETYNLTIQGSSELVIKEVVLQVSGVQMVEDVTTQVSSRVPELQGATDVRFLYADPDFDGDFLALEDLEDLPLDGTIQVIGTPGPAVEAAVPEPKPAGWADEAETGVPPVPVLTEAEAPRTLNLTVAFNVTVSEVMNLDDMVTKLRESIVGSLTLPEGGQDGVFDLAAHRLEGSDGTEVGAAYGSLDEVDDMAKVCLKARAS